MPEKDDKYVPKGRELLEYSEAKLIGLVRDCVPNSGAAQIAALDLKNRQALLGAMDHLSEVIKKDSEATAHLSRVGIWLTVVIALAAIAQVIVMIWSACSA